MEAEFAWFVLSAHKPLICGRMLITGTCGSAGAKPLGIGCSLLLRNISFGALLTEKGGIPEATGLVSLWGIGG